MRAHCAAFAARFSVAAVLPAAGSAAAASSSGPVGSAGPLLVVDLVVRHARQRLARRHLHLQQELQLPARLVEDVGHRVLASPGCSACRRRSRRVPPNLVSARTGSASSRRRDAAVDDVLAVIAGVVPAAADVQRVVAAAVLRARHRLVAGVGRDADVAGRPVVLRRRRASSIGMPLRWW